MPPGYQTNLLHELFSFKLADAGCIIAFAISPEGTRLAAATDNGSIVCYDTRIGHHQVHIDLLPGEADAWSENTGEAETKLVWTSESQLIFSGCDGHLYYINLTHGAMDTPPLVHVTYGFQYHTGRITSLAYDVATHTLVLAYDYKVVILRSAPGDQTFRLVDHIEPKRLGRNERISPFTIQFLRRVSQEIFIAGPLGYIVWSCPGRAFTRWVGPGLAAIGTSALLPRAGDIVITTFNHQVLRWPVGPGGGILENAAVPLASEHNTFNDLRPDTAPATTLNDVTLIARENHIAMVCPGGKILQEVKLPDNHTPRGIQTHSDRVYLALDGSGGDVVFMALTTKKDSQRRLEQLRRTRNLKIGSLTKRSYLKIDLNGISTVALERVDPRTNQATKVRDYADLEKLPHIILFSTFSVGLYGVFATIRVAFTFTPGDWNVVGNVIFLSHSDDEKAVTRWLRADRGFMSKLIAQMAHWVQRLE